MSAPETARVLRATVTEEMEREYQEIERKLKQDAMNPAGGGIGFISPGMLQPRGEKQR